MNKTAVIRWRNHITQFINLVRPRDQLTSTPDVPTYYKTLEAMPYFIESPNPVKYSKHS